MTATQAPIHMLFANATPRVSNESENRTMRVRFRATRDMNAPWLVAGPDSRMNDLVMGAYAVRVGNDWIDIGPSSSRLHEWRSTNSDGRIFRFLKLNEAATRRANRDGSRSRMMHLSVLHDAYEIEVLKRAMSAPGG